MNPKFKYYFTITAGRTGTAWLADLLGANLGTDAVHEPLGIDDFGVNMPDIKIMRSFNARGNNDLVKGFWSRKLGAIAERDLYVETNHTLAKCGLIENLATSSLAKDSLVIILKRDKIRQCVSYLSRGDFKNITVAWQWYLDPRYPNNIGNPAEFLKLGELGRTIWYIYEMDARQEYYKRCYSGDLNFLEVDLEDISSPDGASEFLHKIGWTGTLDLPPPRNETKGSPPDGLIAAASNVINRINYDSAEVVDNYIKSGKRLSGSAE